MQCIYITTCTEIKITAGNHYILTQVYDEQPTLRKAEE